jgi:hypothetical protein
LDASALDPGTRLGRYTDTLAAMGVPSRNALPDAVSRP